jgi:micrococcal nuclease
VSRRSLLIAAVLLAAIPGCAELEPENEPAGTSTGPGGKSGRVTHVADGDTLTISGLGKTRLIGVDTPEVYGGAECYGREASNFTKKLLPEGTRVTYDIGSEPEDRYGRALAYVYKDHEMVNLTLAEEGYAVQLTIAPNVEHERDIRRAVREARENERGLWANGSCNGDADEPAAPGDQPTPERAKRCSDFTSKADAQAYFDNHPDAPMDGDRDGLACESLPE